MGTSSQIEWGRTRELPFLDGNERHGRWKQPCLRAGVDGVTPGCEGGRAPGGELHPGVVWGGGWGATAGPWWSYLPRFRVTWTDADVSASPIPRFSFAVGSSEDLDVPLH